MTCGSDIGGARPLDGVSVLVTRTREQAEGLARPLEALGAEVLYFPVIQVADPVDTAPLDAAITRLAEYDWLIITSTNGVDRFFDRESFGRLGPDPLASVKLAAVGSATARRLAERGYPADLVPVDFRAEGLVAELPQHGLVAGSRVLVPRAEEAREVLPESLRDMGAIVDVVVSYRVLPAASEPLVVRRLAEGRVDIATFASGGTFKQFLSSLTASGLDAASVVGSLALASVGPVTSDAIRDAGYEVAVEAPTSTMASLAESIGEWRALRQRAASGSGMTRVSSAGEGV